MEIELSINKGNFRAGGLDEMIASAQVLGIYIFKTNVSGSVKTQLFATLTLLGIESFTLPLNDISFTKCPKESEKPVASISAFKTERAGWYDVMVDISVVDSSAYERITHTL